MERLLYKKYLNMLDRARERAKKLNKQVESMQMDVGKMDFPEFRLQIIKSKRFI